MIILVIGGLLYIIQVQTDMLKSAHQKPLPSVPLTPPVMNRPVVMGRRRNYDEILGIGLGQSQGSLDHDEGKPKEKRISEINLNENKTPGLANQIAPADHIDFSKLPEDKISIGRMRKAVNKGIEKGRFTNHEDDPRTVREKMLDNLIKHSMLHESVGKLKIHKLELQEVCSDKHAKLKKLRICFVISLSLSIPLVVPNPGVSTIVRV